MIVLMAGLPGTGKSALARALASRLGGSVLDKDQIRLALFSPTGVEYSTAQDDFVMQVMLEAAAWILRKDPARVVILDGRTFSRTYQIDRVLDAAAKLRQPWRILECVCAEETARSRIQSQSQAGEHLAANRSVELYLEVKAHFQLIVHTKTVVDTDSPLAECVNQALNALV